MLGARRLAIPHEQDRVGQLYLTILVARLVGLHMSDRASDDA